MVVNLWHEENERAKYDSQCALTFPGYFNVLLIFRTISWKKFKGMVQQKYAEDTKHLNNVTKLLQNLWNMTRSLLGTIFSCNY